MESDILAVGIVCICICGIIRWQSIAGVVEYCLLESGCVNGYLAAVSEALDVLTSPSGCDSAPDQV